MKHKIITIQVKHCLGCPYSTNDQNLTRLECMKARNRTIFFACAPEEDLEYYIPEWCPIWKAQGQQMEDTDTKEYL